MVYDVRLSAETRCSVQIMAFPGAVIDKAKAGRGCLAQYWMIRTQGAGEGGTMPQAAAELCGSFLPCVFLVVSAGYHPITDQRSTVPPD